MKTRRLVYLVIMVVLIGCAQVLEVPASQLTTGTIEPSIIPQPKWSYVALGDDASLGAGLGDDIYVEYFADYLRQDLGVDLEVHNTGAQCLHTGRLLDLLRIDPELRKAVAEANVITLWIGEEDISHVQNRYIYGNCGGEDNLDCIREEVQQINENIDAILDKILDLNPSEETRIMIADNAINSWYFAEWEEHNCFDVLQKELWEPFHDNLVDAANERGLIVVYTYHGINGPLGNQDNKELYQDGRWHFSKEGHKLIADLHRESWE